MKKFSICAILLLSTTTALTYAEKLQPAPQCQSLHCVRYGIDHIDNQLLGLLQQRLTYVARAGVLKKGKRAVHDPKREANILDDVRKKAQKLNVPEGMATAVFRDILKHSNKYEKKYAK